MLIAPPRPRARQFGPDVSLRADSPNRRLREFRLPPCKAVAAGSSELFTQSWRLVSKPVRRHHLAVVSPVVYD